MQADPDVEPSPDAEDLYLRWSMDVYDFVEEMNVLKWLMLNVLGMGRTGYPFCLPLHLR